MEEEAQERALPGMWRSSPLAMERRAMRSVPVVVLLLMNTMAKSEKCKERERLLCSALRRLMAVPEFTTGVEHDLSAPAREALAGARSALRAKS